MGVTAGGVQHAFVHSGSGQLNPVTDDLGTFGGGNSEANDINDNGQIVGGARESDGYLHAFIHSGSGQLNPTTDDLGHISLFEEGSEAHGINGNVQITGRTTLGFNSGQTYAFMHSGSGSILAVRLICSDTLVKPLRSMMPASPSAPSFSPRREAIMLSGIAVADTERGHRRPRARWVERQVSPMTSTIRDKSSDRSR